MSGFAEIRMSAFGETSRQVARRPRSVLQCIPDVSSARGQRRPISHAERAKVERNSQLIVTYARKFAENPQKVTLGITEKTTENHA